MDLLTLGILVVARQWHVVFPADHSANTTEGRLLHVGRATVALPPNRALAIRRDKLAAPADKSPIRTERQDRVVERTAAVRRLSFVDTDDNTRCGRVRGVSEPLCLRSGDIYGLAPERLGDAA